MPLTIYNGIAKTATEDKHSNNNAEYILAVQLSTLNDCIVALYRICDHARAVHIRTLTLVYISCFVYTIHRSLHYVNSLRK